MLASERRQRLLEQVENQGFVRTAELQRQFGVSHMTILRDLKELEHRGLLRRVRGGAAAPDTRELGFGPRERLNRLEKEAVGCAAAALVASGDSLFLDAGTTCIEVARHLLKRNLPRLYVVTTSVKVAVEMAGIRGVKVTQLGGEIYDQSFGVVGRSVVEALRNLRFDWAFLGICGLDLDAGLTNNNHFEVPPKQAAMRSARRVVFVADASKLGRSTLAQVAPIDEPHTLITSPVTTGDAREETLVRLRALGWEVIVARVPNR